MAELNKSAFHTEEFHCLDFLLLGAGNELCNLYLNCNYVIFIAILLKYLYTVFIGIINIYCCIYTCSFV